VAVTERAAEVAIRRFKPYPLYKSSGVDWLGDVPAHWDVKRNKHVARLESGHTPSRQHPEYWVDCTIPWFGLADVWQIRDGRQEYVLETNEKISELGLANSAARLLPKGTVILSRTASVGFSAILGTDMATTQDFVNWVCGPRIRPEYLLYVLRSMTQEFRRLTMGSTHQTIYMPDVERFSTPVPSIEEQDQIVAFIRRETAKIDALIAKKERLIELLKEKRGTLIAQTVTKGLDPDAPTRDSDVESLGHIPIDWNVRRLKRVSPDLGVGVVVNPSQYVVAEGVPFLYGSDVGEGQIFADQSRRMSRDDSDRLPKSKLRAGDLVMVRVGAPGVTAVVPPELDGSNCASMLVIRAVRSTRAGCVMR
jgi:type I restriction enzyme S subunit